MKFNAVLMVLAASMAVAAPVENTAVAKRAPADVDCWMDWSTPRRAVKRFFGYGEPEVEAEKAE